MKKLLLAVFVVAAFSAASFAGGWGVGVKLGAGQNDPKSMKDAHTTGTLTKAPGVFAIEGLYEWDLKGKRFKQVGSENKIGLRFGFDSYGENKLEQGGTAKEETISLPITVYYKHDSGIKKVSWYAGAGLTFMQTELKVSPGTDRDESKTFPHIMGGAEYRFTKLFALGLDLKYNFSAKITKNNLVLSDRTGLQGVLAARFYF